MMRITLLLIFISFGAFANDISKINQLKRDAEEAYKSGNFEVAASKYSMLIDSLHIEDEGATLNLGHAYYQLGLKDKAQSQYQKLVLSENQNLKSLAYQQLGALSNDPQTLQQAMSYFKESIKADASNLDARFNYELVKKKLKDQQEQNQNKDDQNQENENKPKEPSEWAKQLKEQADRLVELRKYVRAHDLMKEGLLKDPTVEYYADYIERLETVAKIYTI